MAKNVILPALGMAQETGKIVRWLKADGDRVAQGEAIAEIETDKVTVELEAPITGTLSQISAAEGDDVPVGQVIAVILAPDEVLISPAASVENDERGNHQTALTAGATISNEARTTITPTVAVGRIRQASPKARRIAAERGLDIAALRGSGPNGAVLAADVLAVPATNPPANAALAQGGAPDTVSERLSGMSTAWRLMGERTAKSWTTAPHFFLMRDARADAFVAWHAQAQKRAAEKLTYTDLLVKVVATALRLHPQLNASWQNGAIVHNEEINIGLAVAVADGLIVPVIPRADDLSLSGIARQRKDVVERAQTGKLRTGDVQGGTFTISNLGMYGVDAFLAIINAPQAAILAVGALADRVVPVDGVPAVLPMMTLSLSCDHRVVDGARGAQFLATIADLIADPAGL